MGLLDDIKKARKVENAPKLRNGNARKKNPSGHGDGKWQTFSTLQRYRLRRNKARKVARASRAANR